MSELTPKFDAAPRKLTPAEVEIYSRQIIMPQIGGAGQRKLLDARILIVGLGGLGSPAAVYLARAGVGALGLNDFDRVELSNLHRQTLYKFDDVGKPKAAAARANIAEYAPNATLNAHDLRLDASNVMSVIEGYDVVLNGADNFATRYLLNDACHFADKPLVDGAVMSFEGQVSVYVKGRGCYRCIFPNPPPPGTAPNCDEAGVLGVLPGIIGSLQALEAIKIVLGMGSELAEKLLLIDGAALEFKAIAVTRDRECDLCGESPRIKALMDYEQLCGGG